MAGSLLRGHAGKTTPRARAYYVFCYYIVRPKPLMVRDYIRSFSLRVADQSCRGMTQIVPSPCSTP